MTTIICDAQYLMYNFCTCFSLLHNLCATKHFMCSLSSPKKCILLIVRKLYHLNIVGFITCRSKCSEWISTSSWNFSIQQYLQWHWHFWYPSYNSKPLWVLSIMKLWFLDILEYLCLPIFECIIVEGDPIKPL